MNTAGISISSRPMKEPESTIKLLVPEISDLFCMNIRFLITGIRQIRVIIAFSDHRRLSKVLDFEYKCIFLTNYKWIREFGMKETADLIAAYPRLKMLVYLQPQEIQKVVTLFQLGVRGFFSDTVTRNEFQQGLIQLSRAESFYSNDIIRQLLSSGNDADEKVAGPSRITQLEQFLFALLLKGQTNQEITLRLSMTMKAVERARTLLNTKLGFLNHEHPVPPFYNDNGFEACNVEFPHEEVQTMHNNTVYIR